MRPHRTDGISLSFGLIFLMVAVWWAVAQVTSVHLPAAGWLVAGGLILFGVVGLLGAIRSGRRAEVPAPAPAPVPAEAQVETPGDLPPEMHADIVRELLDNPADRVDLHPAYLRHPVSTPPASPAPASAPPASTAPPESASSASPASAPPESAPPAAAPPVSAPPVSAPPVSAPPASAPPAGDRGAAEEDGNAGPR
jgi:hypothetical protein